MSNTFLYIYLFIYLYVINQNLTQQTERTYELFIATKLNIGKQIKNQFIGTKKEIFLMIFYNTYEKLIFGYIISFPRLDETQVRLTDFLHILYIALNLTELFESIIKIILVLCIQDVLFIYLFVSWLQGVFQVLIKLQSNLRTDN